MGAFIHPNYPKGLTDVEINDAISGYAAAIHEASANINAAMQYAPLIQLGITELEARRSGRWTYISMGIAVLSLIVALTAVSIAYWGSESHADLVRQEIVVLEDLRKAVNLQECGHTINNHVRF